MNEFHLFYFTVFGLTLTVSLLVMQGIINAMTVSGLSGVMRRTTQYQLRSLMLGLGVEWFHCPAVGSE